MQLAWEKSFYSNVFSVFLQKQKDDKEWQHLLDLQRIGRRDIAINRSLKAPISKEEEEQLDIDADNISIYQ